MGASDRWLRRYCSERRTCCESPNWEAASIRTDSSTIAPYGLAAAATLAMADSASFGRPNEQYKLPRSINWSTFPLYFSVKRLAAVNCATASSQRPTRSSAVDLNSKNHERY